MTSGQKSLPVAPSIFQFCPARPERRLAQRAVAAHRPHRGRPVHRPVDADGGDQPRPGDHLRPDRFAAGGSAEHGRLGRLRPGQREPGSAGLRRPAVARRNRSAALRPPVGQRVPADPLPGRQAARRQGPGPVPGQPGRLLAANAATTCSTTSAISTASTTRRPGDPEILTRIAQYELAYRMQIVRAGTDRPVARAGPRSWTCMAPTCASRAAMPPTACWPAAWRSAAYVSSSSITWAGTTTATCPSKFATSAATPISPRRP